MTWRVVWSRPALHDMRRLDKRDAERVRVALLRVAETDLGDIKRLHGIEPPEWRLRVGSLRARFEYNEAAGEINVLRVLPRGQAYPD